MQEAGVKIRKFLSKKCLVILSLGRNSIKLRLEKEGGDPNEIDVLNKVVTLLSYIFNRS